MNADTQRATSDEASTAAGHHPDRTPSRWIALAMVPLAVGVLTQRFGEIVYLTRLDRVMDPLTMAARGIDLWNPYWDMGAVQYQQSGYWFPFDLWFGLTHVAGLPVWLSERLFIVALMGLALWGFVRLADSLRIGTPGSRVIGGLAFAISPVILSRVGWQSPFAMGIVLLPWVLLPLVRASESGSTRRAAALSALVITAMGGANAAVTIAMLPAPAIYLLTRGRGPRRASLLRWWLALVPLASLCWIVILYFFARYSPDTLTYTETTRATLSTTPLFEVLRGTSDWIARLPGPQNPAGFALSLQSIPILATAIVAASGLAGLLRRRLPERTFLLITFIAGVAAITGGFGGVWGNPLATLYSGLLDGAFNAFRNVYKFQGLIALPLAFGIVHLLPDLALRERTPRRIDLRRSSALLAIVVLFVAAWPLWQGTLTRGPGFERVPVAWHEANDWLTTNSSGRTLVLPGVPDAEFEWGFTAQIPIQWGSDITWATRSQAPLSGTDVIDYLDTVERSMEIGGDVQLPDYLRRGGFTAVVVPNDQRSEKYGAPPPETIRNAMRASGFPLVASFGDTGYGFGDLRQIDVYGVPDGSVATTYAMDAATLLSGTVASTLDVPQQVFGDRAFILSGEDSQALTPEQLIITDGNQASSIDFGLNRDNRSYIHGGRDDRSPNSRREGRTTRELDGFESVTASSVGPGIIRSNLPAFDPANVLDGDRSSWWLPFREQIDGPDAFGTSDPWIEVTYPEPRVVDSIEIALYLGPFVELTPVDITVITDIGSVATTAQPIELIQSLGVAAGPTRHVRVAIARSAYAAADDVIGIRDLIVPGTPVSRRLVIDSQLVQRASRPGTPDPSWVLTRNRPVTSPLFSLNSEKQMFRGFTVPKSGTFTVISRASGTRGQGLLDWLGATPRFSITADSTWAENPNAGPRNLVDDDGDSLWRSGRDITADGGSALVSMRWNQPRTIDALRLVRDGVEAAPTEVLVTTGTEARRAPVAADGSVAFAPLTTDAMSLRIEYAPVPDDDDESTRIMGFTTIDVPALRDLYPGPVDRKAPYVIECGSGPTLTVGGSTLTFSARTDIAALMDGTPFDLISCSGSALSLPAGPTLLDTTSGSSLATIDQVVIGNPPTMAPPSGQPRSFTIDAWGTNDRTVSIDRGAEGLFVVNEAFNEGWKARLAGVDLEPITIDGWRQAFIIPAGDGGRLELTFAPNRWFRIGTVIGLITLLGVIALALWPDRRTPDRSPVGPGRASPILLCALAVLAAIWCTGLAAVLLVPLWWIRDRHRRLLAPIAFAAMSLAGLLVVIAKRVIDYPTELWGPASTPVSLLAALAFLAVVVTLHPRSRSHGSETESSARGGI